MLAREAENVRGTPTVLLCRGRRVYSRASIPEHLEERVALGHSRPGAMVPHFERNAALESVTIKRNLTKRSSDLLNLRKGSEFRSLLSRPGRRDHEDGGRWLSALAA